MANSGETDLDVLIQSMQPVLCNAVYVFLTVDKNYADDSLAPMLMFQEREGKTLIVSQEEAMQRGLEYEFPCRMITLNIHSALEAIGFLARVTRRLALIEIAVNPVSAFYHDHLFVPADRAEDAMIELGQMIAECQ